MRTAEASIEAGADLALTDEQGDTPLVLLAKGNWKNREGLQVRLAEKLLKAGADINYRNPQGNGALLYASHRGNGPLVEALVWQKVDVGAVNKEGNSALMYAAHGGHDQICILLLENFADPKAKNKFGLTAEQMALKRGHKGCASLLQAYIMAPKREGDDGELKGPPTKEEKAKSKLAFDYSKWNNLEKEMAADEANEDQIRQNEAFQATRNAKNPPMKMEDMGPEAFGLPADTPWPPPDPTLKNKGPFDYSRWDRIVDDIEQRDKRMDRYEYLQANPKYEWRNGQKMRVIY
jgi:hypothetical protein